MSTKGVSSLPEIEKGIPIPPDTKGRKRKYPFPYMEIGDSFVIPYKRFLQNSVCQSAKKQGIRVTTRKEGDNLRVWRIE